MVRNCRGNARHRNLLNRGYNLTPIVLFLIVTIISLQQRCRLLTSSCYFEYKIRAFLSKNDTAASKSVCSSDHGCRGAFEPMLTSIKQASFSIKNGNFLSERDGGYRGE